MCCEEPGPLDLPADVIETLAHYRRLRDERGWDWGDDRIEVFRWVRFSLFGPVFEAYGRSGDWPGAVREVLGEDVPAGIAVVRVTADRAGPVRLEARTGPARPALAGRGVPIDVVLDSACGEDVVVTVTVAGVGHDVAVPAGGAAVHTVRAAEPFLVEAGDASVTVAAVRAAPAVPLKLQAPWCARWSVTDATGGGWFPEGRLPKWDVHHRPYFHAAEVTLDVPAGRLTVACARGLEFERCETVVEVGGDPGEGAVVRLEPARRIDPGAEGWVGGDLHIHMNYSGDLVCTPGDAARMQLGEGLQLASFLAANSQSALVYDRAMLEHYAGQDLPWSHADVIARMGVEYRNDLLGHVHALGPARPPAAYFSGFDRSAAREDWPPNSVACAGLRASGATLGYAHPAMHDFPDGSTDGFFAEPRSVEARELVVDAALGLVDSVDLISPFNDQAAMYLYHRLLSCGLRLAATAGTDVFLSFSHGPGTASNPPGWGRVYAQLAGQPLSVAAFQAAVRAGRTMVTNGPWLAFTVDGQGPGAVLDRSPGDRVAVRVSVSGVGADRVELVGPDGVLAAGERAAELSMPVDGPTWLAAVAHGEGHPEVLDARPFAHTSPVYVDVAGQRVGRAADARWCLDFLDTFEGFLHRHGRFDAATRDERLLDHAEVIEQARVFYRGIVSGRMGPC